MEVDQVQWLAGEGDGEGTSSTLDQEAGVLAYVNSSVFPIRIPLLAAVNVRVKPQTRSGETLTISADIFLGYLDRLVRALDGQQFDLYTYVNWWRC